MKIFLNKIWLTFAQAVTICFALLFVIRIYVPDFPNAIGNQSNQHTLESQLPTTSQVPSTKQVVAAPTIEAGSFRNAVHKATPSVVNIYTTKKVKANPHLPLLDDPLLQFFFGDQIEKLERNAQPENSLGSGVVVSENGLILTNNHVINAADDIEVALSDGRKLSATIVGTDPETDLALIQVTADALPAITFSNSDQLEVGDIVLAIGNPFGVGQTVTQGIVSALGRNQLGINTFENFIQTDASINPGNSGGALINSQGELVGINSAIYSKSGGSMGIGFAIPASLAKQVLDQIAINGTVTRGWVGIEVQDLTPALIESFDLKIDQGVLVTRVLKNSPADQSNIKPGDILIEIDHTTIINTGSMLNIIASLKPNAKASIKFIRAGQLLDGTILIGTRPKQNDVG